MLERRRNARCTAVAVSVLMNSRTQKILRYVVAILLSTDVAAWLSLNEHSSVESLKTRIFSFKCYVDNSHTIYSSGNIDLRN